MLRSRRVWAWFLLGSSALLVEFALLKLLYEVLGWPLPAATAVAAEVLILVKFLVNDRFVFGHPWPTLARLVKYHGASAGAMAVSWIVLNGLAGLLGVQWMLAFIIASAAAFAWSFLTNFLWVWAPAGSTTREAPLRARAEHLRTGPRA